MPNHEGFSNHATKSLSLGFSQSSLPFLFLLLRFLLCGANKYNFRIVFGVHPKIQSKLLVTPSISVLDQVVRKFLDAQGSISWLLLVVV